MSLETHAIDLSEVHELVPGPEVLILMDAELRHKPPRWEIVKGAALPANLFHYLRSIGFDRRMIYQPPITESVRALYDRYQPFHNDLHMNAEFDRALTDIEYEYQSQANIYGNDSTIDPTGAWLGGLLENGAGVVDEPLLGPNRILIGLVQL